MHRGRIIGRGHNRRVQWGSVILLYGIPNVVIGENRTFLGEEDLLRSRGAVPAGLLAAGEIHYTAKPQ